MSRPPTARINAFVTVTPELALRQARAAETAYAQGHAGPLAGIPFTLKDLTPTRGIRTTRGSELYRDWVPDYDAPVAERLYAAGGVLLGKTNTPEMGWKGDTDNRVAGPTHNPWRRGRTAGGSSGGAAAAAAAGFGPLAQGSDGAGSIRIPACMCGVYGFKPSWSLVPQYPASAVEPFSHMGPITRSVADAAAMLTVMAGEDARDRASLPCTTDFSAALGKEIDWSGIRIAWSSRISGTPRSTRRWWRLRKPPPTASPSSAAASRRITPTSATPGSGSSTSCGRPRSPGCSTTTSTPSRTASTRGWPR